MKIFVTGGTGYIGGHLVTRLVEDHEVVCLVHPDDSNENKVALLQKGAAIVYGDILGSLGELEHMMRGYDRVVHLAGLYHFSASVERLEAINTVGAYRVLTAAAFAGVRAVHLSSVAAFGRQEGVFDETAPHGEFLSHYGRTKHEGDEFIRELRDCGHLDVTILFPAPVLGAGDDKVSATYIRAITDPLPPHGWGLPSQVFRKSVLTWVHIDDVVDAIVGALSNDDAVNNEYLVGGHQLSFESFNGLIAKVKNGEEKLRRGWWMPNWLVLIVAWFMTVFCRVAKLNPPWGLCTDEVRVMIAGFRFSGDMAKTDLLAGQSYRPIEGALRDFFDSTSY